MHRDLGQLSILVVCDGNVCRSPSAQFELQLKLPQARIESAGMHAVAGATLCMMSAAAIADNSNAPDDPPARFAREFRSRKLREVNVADFDLTLAATTELRSGLARAYPELRDRFFTLLEAADVLAKLVGESVGGSVGGSNSKSAGQQFVSPLALVAAMNRSRGARPAIERLPTRLSPRKGANVINPLDIPDAHGERGKRHRAVIGLARSSAAAIGDSLVRLTVK